MTPLSQLLGLSALVTALVAVPLAIPLTLLGAAWLAVLLPAALS